MKATKIGRVTFHTLTTKEARQKYGTSFVFVGNPPPRLTEAPTELHLESMQDSFFALAAGLPAAQKALSRAMDTKRK
jgi:hypothetical protein